MGGVSLCMHMCVCFCVDAWLWGWACASLSLGVRGVSGHLCLGRGGVYMWEPVECVRVGGTVDSPPSSLRPPHSACPGPISSAPYFVGIVWREGLSGSGTPEGPTGSSQGQTGPPGWGNNH